MAKVTKIKGMERIVFDKMKGSPFYHYNLNLHLQLYVFAHKYIYKKTVLDAACGTCFGSMIFSTAAKKIIAVDKDAKAIQYGLDRLPFFCPMRFITADLENTVLPTADVCVSLETIEHLKDDAFFLKNLKVKQLVYSLPIGHPKKGTYHKMEFQTPEEAIAYIKFGGWTTLLSLVGDNGLMMGVAERR